MVICVQDNANTIHQYTEIDMFINQILLRVKKWVGKVYKKRDGCNSAYPISVLVEATKVLQMQFVFRISVSANFKRRIHINLLSGQFECVVSWIIVIMFRFHDSRWSKTTHFIRSNVNRTHKFHIHEQLYYHNPTLNQLKLEHSKKS